jgi:hypothetical protein
MILASRRFRGCGRPATNNLFLAAELRITIYIMRGAFLCRLPGLGLGLGKAAVRKCLRLFQWRCANNGNDPDAPPKDDSDVCAIGGRNGTLNQNTYLAFVPVAR